MFLSLNTYSQKVIISSTKLNVLYLGIDNPLEYAINNYDCTNYTLSISDGNEIICDSTCRCIARVHSQGYVYVYVLDKNKNKIIDSIYYRTKMIPDPMVCFNYGQRYYYPEGNSCLCKTIPCIQLGKVTYLDIDVTYTLVDFDFRFVYKNGKEIIYKNKGTQIRSEIKDLIGKSKLGDGFYIENINVIGPDNYVRRINGFGCKIQ